MNKFKFIQKLLAWMSGAAADADNDWSEVAQAVLKDRVPVFIARAQGQSH